MLKVLNSVSDENFDEFVRKHENGTFLQTAAWGKVKQLNGWQYETIAIGKNDQIVATCLILFKKVGLGWYTVGYIPRGGVYDYHDEEVTQLLLQEVTQVAKKYHAIAIDCELNLERGAKHYLEKYGFRHQGYDSEKFIYQMQHDMIVTFSDAELDCASYFSKKNQKFLQIAQKSGLKVLKASLDEMIHFAKLLDETSKRNGISLRDEVYYRQIMQQFAKTQDVDYYLVVLDKELFCEQTQVKLQTLVKEIKLLEKKLIEVVEVSPYLENELVMKQHKVEQLQRDIEFVKQAGESPIYLAGCIVLYCGVQADYLYAASSNQFRYLQPNVLMNYQAMEEAKKRGCTRYNLGGISSFEDGLYPFKASLGAIPKEYDGIYTRVLNPVLYLPLQMGIKCRNKLRAYKKHRSK